MTLENNYGVITLDIPEFEWYFITRAESTHDSTVALDGLRYEAGRFSLLDEQVSVSTQAINFQITLLTDNDLALAESLKNERLLIKWRLRDILASRYYDLSNQFVGTITSAAIDQNIATCEARSSALQRRIPRIERSNSAQQRRAPGDTYYEYLRDNDDIEAVYGWPLSIGARSIQDQRLLTSPSQYAFGVRPNRPIASLAVVSLGEGFGASTPPTIEAEPSKTYGQNEKIDDFYVDITNPDDSDLSVTIMGIDATGLTAAYVASESRIRFSGTTSATATGDARIVIDVNDGVHDVVQSSFTIRINPPVVPENQPPIISSTSTKTYQRRSTDSFSVLVTDTDATDTLTGRVTGLPPGITYVFNVAARRFDFTVNIPSDATIRSYGAKVIVNDGTNPDVELGFTITIQADPMPVEPPPPVIPITTTALDARTLYINNAPKFYFEIEFEETDVPDIMVSDTAALDTEVETYVNNEGQRRKRIELKPLVARESDDAVTLTVTLGTQRYTQAITIEAYDFEHVFNITIPQRSYIINTERLPFDFSTYFIYQAQRVTGGTQIHVSGNHGGVGLTSYISFLLFLTLNSDKLSAIYRIPYALLGSGNYSVAGYFYYKFNITVSA